MKKILLGIMISVFTFQNVFANNEIKDYEFIHDSKNPKYITYSKDNIKPIFNNNTVEWYYNSKNQHLSAFYEEDIINSFKNAMNSWSNISGINFIYKGITDNNINSTNDKIITVGFWSESAFIREFGNFSGYTRMWWSGDKKIYEGYIVLNAGNNGGSNEPTTLNDLEGLITHEIGHLLGIDHSDVEESIMYSNPYHSYNYQRTLRLDDIEIASLLYPSNVLLADVIFDDIENLYSKWFPLNQASQTQDEYYYRYYPNGSYLLEWNGDLWYNLEGSGWNKWGEITNWNL